ncbi:MAG: cytochrome c [Candidatus Methylophosphatis roskildensis]
MKLSHLAFAVSALAAGATSYAQQAPKAEDQIRYRQSIMNVMGRQFGMLSAMAKGDAPYHKDAAVKAAALAETLSALPGPLFGPGLDKGAPTKAGTKIWSEPDKFKAALEKMQGEMKKLPAAAGDVATLKTAVGEIGKACKGCHDDYREKEFRN